MEESGMVFPNGKRDSGIGCRVGIDGPWRSPKRQKDCSWQAMGSIDAEPLVFSSLQVSLQDVCGFEDLKQRMRAYLSLDSCKEVLTVMSQVAKNIDEGRLKMKAHCAIVTDVGMKEKATRVLMCYNPTWLQIGLYIIFGGDSLLATGEATSDQDLMFLKMMIEKQFFAHTVLAKTYAYNKSVGLYKPGYFEALGNVILKRFLLLVLVLDRAKSLSSFPIMYGIDGIDGGSPLLFTKQSNIKSSRQVIYEFLSSEVMHGEGNLVAHLVIVGYKVSYQPDPLLDYNFKITDLFEDLQDGLRLCRAIQLLQQDVSILKKMVVPSDNHKKNLLNCRLAIQYLKQAGVPLTDEGGIVIVAEDIARGDKELILSMLWNMFVHLQIKTATSFLQAVVRSWLTAKKTGAVHPSFENHTQQEIFGRYLKLMVERHSFLRLKKATMVIQGAARVWVIRRHQSGSTSVMDIIPQDDLLTAATVIQSYIRGCTSKARYCDMIVHISVQICKSF